MALLCVVIVHEDVVIGSSSFWMTRPVSPLRLLLAKATGIALVGVALPVAVHLPWWLGFGFGASDLGRAALELTSWHLLCVVPATMMAAITDTFTRFAVWTLVFLLAVFCAGTQMLSSLRVSDLTMSAMVVEGGILVATAFIVIGVAYLARRLVASVALLMAGVAAAAYVGMHWPVDFISPTLDVKPAGEMNSGLGRDVRLIMRSARAYIFTVPDRAGGVVTSFDVEGVPAGYRLSSGYGRQILSWPTGISMRVGDAPKIAYDPEPLRLALGVPNARQDPETQRWLQQQREERERRWHTQGIRANRPSANTAAADFALRGRLVELAIEQRPKWAMETDLYLLRPVKVDEIIASAGGSTHAVGYMGIKFVRREHRIRNVQIGDTSHVREENNILVGFRSGRPAPIWESWTHRELADLNSIVIFNTQSGETIGSIRETYRGTVVGGVSLVNMNKVFSEPVVRRGDRWVLSDPDLLDHMKLAVVRWDEVSRFKREIVVDHLEITPPDPKPIHE